LLQDEKIEMISEKIISEEKSEREITQKQNKNKNIKTIY
jgi:hypothetical protein